MKGAKSHARKHKGHGLELANQKYIKEDSHSQEITLIEKTPSSPLQEFF